MLTPLFVALVEEGSSSTIMMSAFAFAIGGGIAFIVWVVGRKDKVLLVRKLNEAKQASLTEKETLVNQWQSETNKFYMKEKQKFSQLLIEREQDLEDLQAQLSLKEAEQQKLMQERNTLQEANNALEHHKNTNPLYKKQIWHVGIIGISGSGKTALTLRLIDPMLLDIEGFAGTQVDVRYEKSMNVTFNQAEATRHEHVFRFHEWGGEYLVEAQRDILKMCQRGAMVEKDGTIDLPGMHALIFTVDLGDFLRDQHQNPIGPQTFSKERVTKQIEEYFSAQKLPFLLNDTVMAQCRIILLFINKIDLWRCLPEPRETPEKIFEKLILSLGRICGGTPVEIIVGSAQTEEGLLSLGAHLVQRILPENARGGNLGVAEQFKGKRIPKPQVNHSASGAKGSDGKRARSAGTTAQSLE